MAELDKALEIFGLDKIMFNQMKKSDLKVFIQLAVGDETKPPKESNLELKYAYGQLLLNAKTNLKKVRINAPTESTKSFLNKQSRKRSQSISTSIDYCGPTSASIDVLFNSLLCSNSSHSEVTTFI
jgi:hypothetical protein